MLLQGYNAHFAMPDVLVDDSIKADSVLYYLVLINRELLI